MCKYKAFLKKWLSVGAANFLLFITRAHATAEQINDPVSGWNRLWTETLIDISVIGILFALLIAYFAYKYRRRHPDQEGESPTFHGEALLWALIPAFVFMADDFYMAANGWKLWNDYRRVPADRMEIQLESGMYSWDYTYPNGVQAQNELRVPAGKPIMLRMTSRDVVHSHYIHKFRVKEDSMPGRVTYLWFYPRVPGEHIVSCNEYCGIMHSMMTGKVIVMPEGEFNQWYDEEGSKLAVAETSIEPEATPTVEPESESAPAATETEATVVEPESVSAETSVEPEATPTVELEQPASTETVPESAEPAATGSSEESATPPTE